MRSSDSGRLLPVFCSQTQACLSYIPPEQVEVKRWKVLGEGRHEPARTFRVTWNALSPSVQHPSWSLAWCGVRPCMERDAQYPDAQKAR